MKWVTFPQWPGPPPLGWYGLDPQGGDPANTDLALVLTILIALAAGAEPVALVLASAFLIRCIRSYRP